MVDLYTKTEERGKGYGTALIVECENRAKSRGYKKIGLAVNPNLNDHARKLYEKLGYVHDGGKSYIDGVYDGIDDWCVDLEKELK
jgi:ribosomal protein S18 acetylase RimI-like enzyme